jgi:hypothetical protein
MCWPRTRGYVLNMTSQGWLDASQVDRYIWTHLLVVIVPDNLRFNNTALLLVTGGPSQVSLLHPPSLRGVTPHPHAIARRQCGNRTNRWQSLPLSVRSPVRGEVGVVGPMDTASGALCGPVLLVAGGYNTDGPPSGDHGDLNLTATIAVENGVLGECPAWRMGCWVSAQR